MSFMSCVLSGNQISELRRDDLRSLAVSLKTLDLSGNSLASVPEGIFWDLQVEQSSPNSFKLEIQDYAFKPKFLEPFFGNYGT